MPSSSIAIGTAENEETLSTMSATSGYFASVQQISGRGFMTPVEVSLWMRVTASNRPVASLRIELLRIDVLAPIDLERLGFLAAAARDVEPLVGKRAAHAAEDALGDEIADRRFHHAPSRGGGKKDWLLRAEQFLEPGMNGAIELAEGFAAVADHRPRESRPRFWGNFDRTGDEELVVRRHQGGNVQRSIFNVQP